MSKTTKTVLLIMAVSVFGAVISGCVLWYIVHVMRTPAPGFSDPPNPSVAGLIQVVLAAIATGGFSLSAIATPVIAWIVSLIASKIKPSLPTPSVNIQVDPVPTDNTPKSPKNDQSLSGLTVEQKSILDDLPVAFGEWIVDRGNAAKARRFYFDLIEAGILLDPDPDTRKWFYDGSEIIRKKFFPSTVLDPKSN